MKTSTKAFGSLCVPDILPVAKSWNVFKTKGPSAVQDFGATVWHQFLQIESKASNSNSNLAIISHIKAMNMALDQVFSSLYELPDHVLLDLGKRHARYPGFHVGLLASFALSISNALQQHLGVVWNSRLKMRWERVIAVMMQTVSAGVQSASKKMLSAVCSDHYAAQYPEFLDLRDIHPVMSSWEVIQRKLSAGDYRDMFGELVFRKLFELAPGAKALFPFGRFRGDLLFQSRQFKAHSMKVMSTFDMVVSSLLEIEKAPLVQLGARHACFVGVQVEQFAVLTIAILASLENVLGDIWTDELKSHWVNVLSFVRPP
eukprot:scaffold9526_cov247-Amphora_coffeaeformis.AAC.5